MGNVGSNVFGAWPIILSWSHELSQALLLWFGHNSLLQYPFNLETLYNITFLENVLKRCRFYTYWPLCSCWLPFILGRFENVLADTVIIISTLSFFQVILSLCNRINSVLIGSELPIVTNVPLITFQSTAPSELPKTCRIVNNECNIMFLSTSAKGLKKRINKWT